MRGITSYADSQRDIKQTLSKCMSLVVVAMNDNRDDVVAHLKKVEGNLRRARNQICKGLQSVSVLSDAELSPDQLKARTRSIDSLLKREANLARCLNDLGVILRIVSHPVPKEFYAEIAPSTRTRPRFKDRNRARK